MMKYVVVLVLVLAALGAGYYLGFDSGWEGAMEESATTNDTTSMANVQYIWQFENKGEDSTGMPKTAVTLVANGKAHALGTFDGSCVDMKASSWKMDSDEVAGAVCWFAGGGKEIGVFAEGGKHVVKVGDVDEGSAETQGFRGNFEAVLSL